jgi:UDP-N-acetylmuramoylalanine--D-glutamate ligase
VSGDNWIAITGTNGKTTVTRLSAHLLNASGVRAHVAGTIGTSCIEVVSRRQAGDYLVAELSSYQLHSSVDLAPQAAALLNITPDHLSWHGGLDSYAADKLRILANLAPQCPAVVDATLPQTRAVVRQLRREGRRVIALGTSAGINDSMVERCGAAEAAYVDKHDGLLKAVIGGEHLQFGLVSQLQIKGPHNLSNALAAAVCASYVGVQADAIASGLASFKPLEHRFEPCGEVAGVSFINDSKATNTDAAIKAIIAFADDGQTACADASDTAPIPSPETATAASATQKPQVLVLLGGVDKGTELDDLAAACKGNCKYAICYGEAAERFYQALAPVLPTLREQGFAAAFDKAVELANPGDVVLLAPACASFDEFESFEKRGAAFKSRVAQLGEHQTVAVAPGGEAQ